MDTLQEGRAESDSAAPAMEPKALRSLIEKYSGNTPRYTSYPTAVEFSELETSDWRAALNHEVSRADKVFRPSLYLHLPFCATLCYFCACNKKIAHDDSQVAPYIKSLSSELRAYRELCGDFPLEQLHWGGGTPNFFSPSASEDLFDICARSFATFAPDADVSVEIDPRTISVQHLETYKKLGFNRVSLGVQDFNPQVQEAINRIQAYAQTRETIDAARELGFSSINFDLIYGLPLQTESSFRETLQRVIELMPERIALYGYAHVTWKKKVQKTLQRHDLPTPQERISLFLMALKELTDAGYEYIGMDHFALAHDSLSEARAAGTLKRNFMGYSTHQGTSVIGCGVSSISSCDSMLAQNSTDLEEYMARALRQGMVTQRGLGRSPEDQLRGELIENILCVGEIDIPEFEKKWGIQFSEKFSSELQALQPLEDDHLVSVSDRKILVSAPGRLFMRNIASVFDSYLAKHSAGSTFSQSV